MNLEFINSNLEKFYKENNLAYWKHIVENIPFSAEHFKKEALEFFSAKEINHFIEYSFNRAKRKNEKRKYSLLRSYFKLQRIELNDELIHLIEEAFNLIKNYKYSLNEEVITERELRERVAEAKDSDEYHKYSTLWQQFHEEYKGLALQIIHLRNKLAQEEGYSSFPSLYFSRYEISCPTIFSILNSMEGKIIHIARSKKYSVKWRHKQELRLREVLPKKGNALLCLNNLLRKWGVNLSDTSITIVNDIHYATDFPSNVCLPITIPSDIRVFIFSTKPCLDFYYTLFHEIGHALHYSFIEQEDFIFKINPPWYDEAMASLVDKFLSIDECIEEGFTKERKKIKLIKMLNQSEDYRAYLNRIIEFIFEYNVYTQNLSVTEIDDLYVNLYRKYLGIEDMKIDWGYFLIQNSRWSLYGISYVIANAIVNQLISCIYKRYKKYLLQEVFSFIKENFYEPANVSTWKEKIEKATSQPFSFSYFFKK